jgi:hypothetical protein
MESCPFPLNKKEQIKCYWVPFPKVILWKLWLEHNSRIFKGKFASAAHVVAKAKALLGDFLSSQHLPTNKRVLTSIEEDWMSSLLPKTLKLVIAHVPSTTKWEIRMNSSTFALWRNALQRHNLFFDGASKGNPGAARGGGVLWIPRK